MSIEEHVEEFIAALHGGKGDLDSWLECNNEAECRAAIFGAIDAEREACARIAETPISGEQDDITMAAKDRVAKAIRMRSNAK